MTDTTESTATSKGSSIVLLTLASAQFLMVLDSSVMNVSIEEVANDVGTTVTGIQGAITAYTLVMAALMLAGAKLGDILGRGRVELGSRARVEGDITSASLAIADGAIFIGRSIMSEDAPPGTARRVAP